MATNFTFPDEWTTWMIALASVLHQRSAWRFTLLVAGIVFANGRRTITSWFSEGLALLTDIMKSWNTFFSNSDIIIISSFKQYQDVFLVFYYVPLF